MDHRTSRYLNVHVLHPVPFSNPNRDDTGAPKTTVYGGAIRGRMSSQAGKRAARIAFEGGSSADKADRTKFAGRHLQGKVDALLAAGEVDLSEKEREKLADNVGKELGKLTGKAEDAKETLVWLAEEELNQLAEKIATKHAGGSLALEKDDIDEVLSGTTESLTIAAFGRMFANRDDLKMEAATQVAHSFTTHAQQVDLDYFTAVDELQPLYDTPDEDGRVKGAGAGHLDVNEYHSGVFYRYFNVNRDDLADNWGPLARRQSDDETVERLEQFLTAMIRELPSGRDSTAAHQTAPSFVMVTFAPRGTSFAPAFETPVAPGTDGGYVRPSIEELSSYADKVLRVDGDDNRLVFDLDDPASTPLTEIVGEAARWLTQDGEK